MNGETVQSLRDAIRAAQLDAEVARWYGTQGTVIGAVAVGLILILALLFLLHHCKDMRRHDDTNRRIDHVFANLDLKKKRAEVESWEEKTADTREATQKVRDGDLTGGRDCGSPLYAGNSDSVPRGAEPDVTY